MDGTLVDSEPCHEQAFDHALAELDMVVPPSAQEDLLGSSEPQVHEYVRGLGADLTLHQWAELKWKYYQLGAHSIERRTDVQKLMDRCVHLPMALVSNSSRRVVDLNLISTGLLKQIPITIARDDVRDQQFSLWD